METKIKKEVGHLKSMSIHINGMNIDKIDFKEIAVFIGPNGVGKTFMLILNWIVGTVASIYASSKSIQASSFALQYILDKSFMNQDFTGPVTAEFENLDMEFELEAGKVTKFNISTKEELSPSGFPVFMSKNTRTYDQVLQYIKMKKMLGMKSNINLGSIDEINKLSDMYRIYDILFIEKLIMKLSSPIKFTPDMKDMFKDSYDLDITTLWYDDEKTDIFYTNSENVTKSTTTLGAGHQSVLNMFSMSGT